MKNLRAPLFLLIPLFFIATAAQSAVLLYQKNGISVASAGDVDGDGKADFIIGDPGTAYAYVYSGATGALLYQKNGWTSSQLGRSVASAGDVNGDGKTDFIIGAPVGNRGNAAYVYSGATGVLLYQKNQTGENDYMGVSVASTGDVDGDAIPDFIIGAHLADPGGFVDAGSAYVYSGATGNLLYQKNGAAAGDFLGISVAPAGDVNGDGKADFIIGAYGTDPGGFVDAGSAYVYSGATGALLYQKDGAAVRDNLGLSVAGAGDVNGDGITDFIIGAPLANPGGLTDGGSAYVYSGATGNLLYQKNGAGFDQLGSSVAMAGDVNGDGKTDFIIGAPFTDGDVLDVGSAYLYSGATGVLLLQVDGAALQDRLGFSVASAGDVNGDGRAEIIIGADRSHHLSNATYVYSLCAGAKGDMNADASLTSSDVVLMLNCVFFGTGSCDLCFADVNCDGVLTSPDVVLELNAAFLGLPINCLP